MDKKTCVGTWSDPLSVSVPKTKMYQPLFLLNLQKIVDYFQERYGLNSLFVDGKGVRESEEYHRYEMSKSPCNC